MEQTSSPKMTTSKFGEKRRMRSIRDRCRSCILNDKIQLWEAFESARGSDGHEGHNLDREKFIKVLQNQGVRLQEPDAELM